MMRPSLSAHGLLAVLTVLVSSSPLFGQETGSAHIFEALRAEVPDDFGVRLSLKRPADLVQKITSGYLLRSYLERPELADLRTSPEARQAMLGLSFFKAGAGMGVEESINVVAGEGLFAAYNPKNKTIIVISRSGDAEKLPALYQKAGVLRMNQQEPLSAPNLDGEVEEDSSNPTIMRIGNVFLAHDSGLLLGSNKDEAVRAMLRKLKDLSANPPTDSRAAEEYPDGADAVLTVDYTTAPDLRKGLEQFAVESNDVGRAILVDGLLSRIRPDGTSRVLLFVEPESIRLETRLPSEPFDDGASERDQVLQEVFFGESSAPPLMNVELPETVLTFSTYRNLSAFWLTHDMLLSEKASAQLDIADSQLSTVFGGFGFGDEILGSIGPNLQVLVTNPPSVDREVNRDPGEDVSAVIPGLALVAPLGGDQEASRRLRIAFQTLISLRNVDQQQAVPVQFELRAERLENGRLVVAEYSEDDRERAPITIRDLTPTLVTTDELLILASREDVARQILQAAAAASDTGTLVRPLNDAQTLLRINGATLRALADRNREFLIQQNIVEKGHKRAAAERETGLALAALTLIESLTFAVRDAGDDLRMQATITFRAPDVP